MKLQIFNLGSAPRNSPQVSTLYYAGNRCLAMVCDCSTHIPFVSQIHSSDLILLLVDKFYKRDSKSGV